MADLAPHPSTNKRTASSPPLMEESAKRQPRMDKLYAINLESDTDHSEADDQEDTTLTHGLEHPPPGATGEDGQNSTEIPPPEGGQKVTNPITLETVNEKVDRLLLSIGSIDKKLEKGITKNRKKFQNIQNAHNVVVDQVNKLSDRADDAENYNKQTRDLVKECLQRLNELGLRSDLQDRTSNTRLEAVEKSVIDLGTEVKEKKIVISGVKEEKGENTRQIALKTLKRALSVAKTAQETEGYDGPLSAFDPNHLSQASIDQAYRVGPKKAWPPRNFLFLSRMPTTDLSY